MTKFLQDFPASALQRTAIHLALIVFCGAAIYSNTFQVPFYFDDYPCIVRNPVVQQFSLMCELDRFRELGLEEDIRNSLVARVVAYTTFVLNYRVHGLNLTGYHLVNLAIHLANALLVYTLVRTTVSRCRRDAVEPHQGSGLALAVALLFVAHPVQTSAVTYIVQRFASLATFFCFCALLAYSCSVLSPGRRRRSLCYAGALLAMLLAMFTKEIAFTMPVLIALYDVAFLPGQRRERWRRLAPMLAMMSLLPATVAGLATMSQVTGGTVSHSLDLMNLDHASRWEYFLTQWRVVITYLRLLAFPAGLNLDHDVPLQKELADPALLASGLFLAALLGMGLYLLLRRATPAREEVRLWRLVGYGIVWFFVALAMESTIITLGDLMQEYRLYLPSFGFFLAAAAAFDILRGRLLLCTPLAGPALGVAAALVVISLGFATFARNRVWSNEEAFWGDSVLKSPAKARPRINLAWVYLRQNRLDAAEVTARMASAGSGHTLYTRLPLALLFNKMGLNELALSEMQEAIRFAPDKADYYGILGDLYLNTGRAQEAADAFRTALRLDPADRWSVRATLEELEKPQVAPEH